MADQTFRSTDKSGAPFEKATSAAKNLADQALAKNTDTAPVSGRQEFLENLVNRFCAG